MSGRRGLLVQQPAQRSTGAGAPTNDHPRAVPLTRLAPDDALPAHQPLELPLNDAAMSKIFEIANRSASLRLYDTHLKNSANLLRDTIGSVHDTLSDRKLQLEVITERRRERGQDEPSEAQKELAEAVARLQGSVDELTTRIELGVRTTIDRQMELEDEREALKAMAGRLEARQRDDRQWREEHEKQREAAAADRAERRRRKRRRTEGEAKAENGENDGNDDDDDDDDDLADDTSRGPPPASALSLLVEERTVRAAAYAQLSSHQKYGLNNDYIAFKQAWHFGMYPDNDVELPSAAQWFTAAGEPARYGRSAEGGGGGGGGDGLPDNNGVGGHDDEDDDLVVQREVISFKCPLSLVTMVDPYRSRVCKHAFEHAAILEYLRSGQAAARDAPKQCPQTGCSAAFTARDLVPDTIMRRRIQRAAKMEQRRHDAAATSDMEDGGIEDAQDVDDMIVDAGRRRTKAESVARSVKRERFQSEQRHDGGVV